MSYQLSQSLNSDDGATVLTVKGRQSGSFNHTFSIDSAAGAGTLAIEGKPVGLGEFKEIANTLDLSDSANQVATFQGHFSEFRVTPSGMAADTDYDVGLAGT